MLQKHQKRFISSILILFSSISVPAQDLNEKDILGVWLMANQNVKIHVTEVGNKYEGKVVWMDTDANKKNFNMGDIIVDNLKYNSTKQTYEHGHFYGRGHKLKCEVQLIEFEKLAVRVSKGFIKQTRYCTRVKTINSH